MDLKHTIGEFTNPFEDECDKLIKMVAKPVLPEKILEHINKRKGIGEDKFVQFASERTTTNYVNIWAPQIQLPLPYIAAELTC